MANDITVSKEIVLNAEAGRLRVRHVGIGNREAVVITGDAELSTPVPFRLQSSCLFSESLLSTDCDCALQLHEALKIVCAEGGLLIYLYEEGRNAMPYIFNKQQAAIQRPLTTSYTWNRTPENTKRPQQYFWRF